MNEKAISRDRFLKILGIAACLLPIVAIIGAFVFVTHLQKQLMGDGYLRYRELWGGNPSEVFSHWLDVIFMSGSAFSLAWLLSVGNSSKSRWLISFARASMFLSVFVAGIAGLGLDQAHGEGTVFIAYPLFFLPILLSTYYLLREVCALFHWKPKIVVTLSVLYVALHVGAQLKYEPSETGGPNMLVLLLWLGSVTVALVWMFIKYWRKGRIQRWLSATFQFMRKPVVLGGLIGTFLIITVAATVSASNIRRTHAPVCMQWLDNLESKLTDGFVAQLKQAHTYTNGGGGRIPVSNEAQALLADSRVQGSVGLRIYLPVNETDYLYFCGTLGSEYCDIRQLAADTTEAFNQGFIDDLRAAGGTHQTGYYSALLTPYMAGRVIKDSAGRVKAICIINTQFGP